MTSDGYFAEAPERAQRPARLRALRVLLFADAALTLLLVVSGTQIAGFSVAVIEQLTVFGWPGAVALVAALRLKRPSRVGFWPIVVPAAWQIVLAVAQLSGGDPRGLTAMFIPLAILVLALSPSVRRHLAHRRKVHADGARGASMVEYAALIVVAALILGGIVATGMPGQVGSGTRAALCSILQEHGCQTSDAGRDTPPSNGGKDPNGPDRNGGNPGRNGPGAKPACHGFWGCTWYYVTNDPFDTLNKNNGPCRGAWECAVKGARKGIGQVLTGPWNLDKAIVQDAGGIVDLVRDPSIVVDAVKYVAAHPLDAARQLVWDDETAKLWSEGNYWGAINRTAWNIGSWFIPYGDIAKGVGTVGRLGKLGRLATKTGELGRIGRLTQDVGKSADRARRLAARGDRAGARRAADDARRKADEAERQARTEGCAVSLRDPGVVPLVRFGRYAPGALPACAAPDKNQATQAVRLAAKARLVAEGISPEEAEKIVARAAKQGQLKNVEKLVDSTIDPVLGRKLVRDATAALDSGQLSKNAYKALLGRAASATDKNALRDAAAEINEAKRIVDSGDVAPGTKVEVGLKKKANRPITLLFGKEKVELGDISEVDAAYKATDGTIHVVEVKSTVRALVDKLRDGSQNKRLGEWADSDRMLNRVDYKVDDAKDAEALFRPYPGSKETPISRLRKSGASLRIGDKYYSPDRLEHMNSPADL